MSSVGVITDVLGILAFGSLGALCAWITRRFSTLSARNFYAPAAVFVAALGVAVALRAWGAVMGIAPVCAFAVASATHGRRMRLADLGAGEELRSHEQARRWLWQPAPPGRANLPALPGRARPPAAVARSHRVRTDGSRGSGRDAVAAR